MLNLLSVLSRMNNQSRQAASCPRHFSLAAVSCIIISLSTGVPWLPFSFWLYQSPKVIFALCCPLKRKSFCLESLCRIKVRTRKTYDNNDVPYLLNKTKFGLLDGLTTQNRNIPTYPLILINQIAFLSLHHQILFIRGHFYFSDLRYWTQSSKKAIRI